MLALAALACVLAAPRAAAQGDAAPASPAPALSTALPTDDAAATHTLDAREVLAEMARIEAQLDEARRARDADQRALQTTSATLESLGSGLRQREQQSAAGEADLAAARRAAERERQVLEAERQQESLRVSSARNALRHRSALALSYARDPEVPIRHRALVYALTLQSQVDATAATRAGLRIEQDLADLRAGSARLAEAGRYYSSFTELGASQLRARHAELAARLAELNTQVKRTDDDEQRLTAQAAGLRSLLAQLAEQAAKTPPTPTPAPAESNPAVPTTDPAVTAPVEIVAQPSPVPTEPPTTESASSDAPATADGVTPEGTRRLFWRATTVTVLAPVGGQVIFSEAFAGYRHLLIIDHGAGWRTLYGNLTQPRAQQGQMVTAGEPLGDYQAAQGQQAEPLWFEVRKGTTAIAPDTWEQLGPGWESRLFSAAP